MLGNNQAAHQAIERGMTLLEGDNFQEQNTRLAKAFLLQQRSLLFFTTDRDRSQSDLQESLRLYRLVGNTWREAQILTRLAMVACAHGHYPEAVAYLEESLKL